MKTTSENRVFFFLFVQLLSLVGSKVSHVAIGFWIYNQSRSVMDFSIVLFCSFFPNIVSSFISGPLVDRFRFTKSFGLGDIVSAAVMLATAALVSLKTPSFVYLYLTIFAASSVSALQWVALNTYLPEALKNKNLVRATGWLSTATSAASLLATSLASLLISMIGLQNIFILDAATYLISAGVVFYLLPPCEPKPGASKASSFVSDFKAGLLYLKSQKDISTLIALFAAFNFFIGININLMTPLFIERYSVKYAGYVLGFLGAGSLISGLVQSSTGRLAGLRHHIPLLMLFIFIENALIGQIGNPIPAAMLMFLLGVSISLTNTSTTLVLQENVDASYRGRIFAAARGFSWIALPLSQFSCGVITDNIFNLFFKGLGKGDYLGNTFLSINCAAVLLFMCYYYFGERLKFKRSMPGQDAPA